MRTRLSATIFILFPEKCFVLAILHVDDVRVAFRPEDEDWTEVLMAMAKPFQLL